MNRQIALAYLEEKRSLDLLRFTVTIIGLGARRSDHAHLILTARDPKKRHADREHEIVVTAAALRALIAKLSAALAELDRTPWDAADRAAAPDACMYQWHAEHPWIARTEAAQ